MGPSICSPHVRLLDLVDQVTGTERHFKAAKKGNRVTLTTEDGDREWLVVSADRAVRPGRWSRLVMRLGAIRSKGELGSAVVGPCRGGQLSAFFPVKSDVTLSGRINAPWKLSDDRINVIERPFNFEILADVLPQLVVAARKDLIADGAYGRYIDVLPAQAKRHAVGRTRYSTSLCSRL